MNKNKDPFEKLIVTRPVTTTRLGRMFKDFRIQSGLTVQELADAMRIKRTRISMWELGKAVPRLPEFVHLCRILKVTPTKRFGVDIDIGDATNKHVLPTDSYWKWFHWWNDYYRHLPKTDKENISLRLRENLDVSMYRPEGSWNDKSMQ